MSALLNAAILWLGVALSACMITPAATEAVPVPIPDKPAVVVEVNPVHMAILVRDDWEGSFKEYPAEYIILILNDGRVNTIPRKNFNEGIQALVQELWSEGKVRVVTLALTPEGEV